MILKRTIIFLAIAALLPLFACKMSVAGDEPVYRQALDDGLVIIVKEAPDAKIEALRLYVKTGSSMEGHFVGSGISHFTEHMIFKGTKSRPVGRIQEDIKAIGGYMNAATSYDYTDFEVDVPGERFYEGADILLDAVVNPVFDKRELKKERDVILREIKMNDDDPDKLFSNLVWSSVYTVHPYKYPVIGFQDLFEKLTADDLKKYHDKKYTPNNMVFVAVGPVKQPEVFTLVKTYFKNIKMGWQDTSVLPQEPEQAAVKEIKEQARVSLTRLALCFKTIPVNSEDLFALDALSIILGHGNSSRLYKKLKEEADTVYSVDSFNYTPKYQGFFGIMCVLEREKEAQAKKAILGAIKQMKTAAPGAAELAKAKKQVLSDYLFNLESVDGQAEDIATDEVICSDANFSKKYIAGINSVSGKDIMRVANKYLNDNNLTIVSLEPVGAGQRVRPLAGQSKPTRANTWVCPYTAGRGNQEIYA